MLVNKCPTCYEALTPVAGSGGWWKCPSCGAVFKELPGPLICIVASELTPSGGTITPTGCQALREWKDDDPPADP